MKNLYLFFQINVIVFKVFPVRHNALMPMFFPILETVREIFFRDGLQYFLRFGFYLLNRVETVSPKRSFEFVEQPEVGAKSNEYGHCETIWVEFLAKCSRRTNAVWDGA